MFWMNSEKPSNKIDNLIGKELVLNGAIEIIGGTRLDGVIFGDVSQKSEATLTVSEFGFVTGNVTVDHLILGGTIIGNITVNKTLVVLKTAVISGDIQYNAISVTAGAEINGTLSKICPKDSN